jgi:hypothetical protein
VYGNPLRYIDPSGHDPRCGPDGIYCGVDPTQATTGSLLGPQWNNNSGSGRPSGGGGNGSSGSSGSITDVPSTAPHSYWAINPVCADYFWIHCTDTEVAEYLLRFQYPGQFFWQPARIGGSYNVFPERVGSILLIGYFYPGSGAIFVESNGITVSNIAYSSHIFYDGRVDRTPVRINGIPYVVTHGSGTNDGFHLGSFNLGSTHVSVGIPGTYIDQANNLVGTTVFNGIDGLGLMTYTTIAETWQAFTGRQQYP